MPSVQLVGKILKTVKKLHLKQLMSQCGKSIPVQSMNPGCGYEIAVSLNTSEDVKSTICCQGWVMCVSDTGLWKMSHPTSSQSRGKIKGQWGAWARQQSIHPNSSCKTGLGAMELPKNERKIKYYHWTSKAKAFGKCHESQRDRKLVHGEGTVRLCFANCRPAKWEGNWLQNSDTDMHET